MADQVSGTHDERVEMALADALGDRPGALHALAVAARRLVASMAAGSSEILYQTYAVSNVFTFSGKPGDGFIHIATYKNHVNLGFNRGAFLQDEHGLLEGTGKAIRHIRLRGEETLRRPEVLELIEQAVAQGARLVDEKGSRSPQVFVDKSKRG